MEPKAFTGIFIVFMVLCCGFFFQVALTIETNQLAFKYIKNKIISTVLCNSFYLDRNALEWVGSLQEIGKDYNGEIPLIGDFQQVKIEEFERLAGYNQPLSNSGSVVEIPPTFPNGKTPDEKQMASNTINKILKKKFEFVCPYLTAYVFETKDMEPTSFMEVLKKHGKRNVAFVLATYLNKLVDMNEETVDPHRTKYTDADDTLKIQIRYDVVELVALEETKSFESLTFLILFNNRFSNIFNNMLNQLFLDTAYQSGRAIFTAVVCSIKEIIGGMNGTAKIEALRDYMINNSFQLNNYTINFGFVMYDDSRKTILSKFFEHESDQQKYIAQKSDECIKLCESLRGVLDYREDSDKTRITKIGALDLKVLVNSTVYEQLSPLIALPLDFYKSWLTKLSGLTLEPYDLYPHLRYLDIMQKYLSSIGGSTLDNLVLDGKKIEGVGLQNFSNIEAVVKFLLGPRNHEDPYGPTIKKKELKLPKLNEDLCNIENLNKMKDTAWKDRTSTHARTVTLGTVLKAFDAANLKKYNTEFSTCTAEIWKAIKPYVQDIVKTVREQFDASDYILSAKASYIQSEVDISHGPAVQWLCTLGVLSTSLQSALLKRSNELLTRYRTFQSIYNIGRPLTDIQTKQVIELNALFRDPFDVPGTTTDVSDFIKNINTRLEHVSFSFALTSITEIKSQLFWEQATHSELLNEIQALSDMEACWHFTIFARLTCFRHVQDIMNELTKPFKFDPDVDKKFISHSQLLKKVNVVPIKYGIFDIELERLRPLSQYFHNWLIFLNSSYDYAKKQWQEHYEKVIDQTNVFFELFKRLLESEAKQNKVNALLKIVSSVQFIGGTSLSAQRQSLDLTGEKWSTYFNVVATQKGLGVKDIDYYLNFVKLVQHAQGMIVLTTANSQYGERRLESIWDHSMTNREETERRHILIDALQRLKFDAQSGVLSSGWSNIEHKQQHTSEYAHGRRLLTTSSDAQKVVKAISDKFNLIVQVRNDVLLVWPGPGYLTYDNSRLLYGLKPINYHQVAAEIKSILPSIKTNIFPNVNPRDRDQSQILFYFQSIQDWTMDHLDILVSMPRIKTFFTQDQCTISF